MLAKASSIIAINLYKETVHSFDYQILELIFIYKTTFKTQHLIIIDIMIYIR